MTTPKPGGRVRGSTTGRPLMAALDLFGRRWNLRVIWELRHGPLTFRALRERCDDASPTVLNTRLAELREARLVVHEKGEGYRLTALGEEVIITLEPLIAWSARWRAALDHDPPDAAP